MKLLVIGSPNTGKSALVRHYVDQEFSELYGSTIGVDFRTRDGWQIWDCAGQDRFRSITATYYRGAQVVLIVYSITDRRSFSLVSQWLKEAQRFASSPSPHLYLIGAKADLERHREVSTCEGAARATELGMEFAEVSACNFQPQPPEGLTGIEMLFRDIRRRIEPEEPILEQRGNCCSLQ